MDVGAEQAEQDERTGVGPAQAEQSGTAQPVAAQPPGCAQAVIGRGLENLLRTSAFDQVSRPVGVYLGGLTSLTTLRTSLPLIDGHLDAALSLPSVAGVAERAETELDVHRADTQLRPRRNTRRNDTVVSPFTIPA